MDRQRMIMERETERARETRQITGSLERRRTGDQVASAVGTNEQGRERLRCVEIKIYQGESGVGARRDEGIFFARVCVCMCVCLEGLVQCSHFRFFQSGDDKAFRR